MLPLRFSKYRPIKGELVVDSDGMSTPKPLLLWCGFSYLLTELKEECRHRVSQWWIVA